MKKQRQKTKFRFKPFSKKQRKVLNWWTSTSPVKDANGIIADGAIRSGKTLSMSISFIMWAMSSFEQQAFAMCGKTIGSFRRNVLFWLKLMLPALGYKLDDRRSENLVVITKNGAENYFYIFGGKDESSQDLIQGLTLAGVFFDEVALMPQSFVNQATGRCSVEGRKFWFNCNPDGPFHWFKTDWIDEAEAKEMLYLHFTMDDNLSLAEKIKESYRRLYTGIFYQRYILGLWAMAEGVIYDMFDADRHVVDLQDLKGRLVKGQCYVSVDYGTQNATVFLLWKKGFDGIWYCTREYYYSGREKGRQKTDSEYAEDMIKWLGKSKPRAIIVDPSAASFIAELRKRGFKVLKAKNDVEDGIRVVGTKLNADKIKFANVCENTQKEFASYVWDEKASAKGSDKPVKDHDHAMDAVRYFVYLILANNTARILNKKKKGFV